MNIYLIIFLVILFVGLVFFPKKTKHQRNVLNSKTIILKLNSFKFDGQKLNYLKKINPFVFEELVLSAFEKKGFTIKRNKKYTGDGGIDGVMFDKENTKYLIQAKRYANYINLAHIKDFGVLLNQKKCKGFFVHTGKTGKGSSAEVGLYSNMEIISGSKLINLITNEKV